MTHPVEAYLTALRDIHRSGAGVAETSYYGALANLLNDLGKSLKPRVRCLINLQNAGAGLPDGGLFTADQFPKASAGEPRQGQLPSRGAIEVKGTRDDVSRVADTPQVQDYLHRYRQVLVTNYRDFLLLGHDADGQPCRYEECRLAEDEEAFWSAVEHPQKLADARGEQLAEFLKRAMLRQAELVEPKDVAWFLASYAREAKARVEARKDLPQLAAVRAALEEALGMKFQDEKGEHFFRSTLVQTLFYGVFSAWVLWDKQHKGDPTARFNWHEAIWYLHVPMISALFEQISTPAQLGPLGVAEVLNWAGETLHRVNRGQFFSRFEEGHAVQYFYEPFLQAFDPELRKELGVWYTPPEIVQYMVERVDRVLREELGIADGLADPNVYVLDPCCGTGAYLVEVLGRIRRTLQEKGADALIAQDVKKAAMGRVFGFEILPAPFVISHLQLGLLLQNLGAPLSDEQGERAGVFLTNALTGWEPPEGPKKQLGFPGMGEERDAADRVKQEVPVLVVLGNPPYNGFAGVSPAEEEGLVEPYKRGLREWGITKNYLDDLYVRFFRLAERRIAEKTGRGVVCYISNFSYLDDPSFVVMRQRFLGAFQRMWFDCMNGDSRETGKRTPDGQPDPSVFSAGQNTQGIRVGTAIALMVRRTQSEGPPRVLFRHFWGGTKRLDLLASLRAPRLDSQYEVAAAARSSRFSFKPLEVSEQYEHWPSLAMLSECSPMLGLNDNRSQGVHAIGKAQIAARMRAYYDPAVSIEHVRQLHSGLATDAASFRAAETRQRLIAESRYDEQNVRRFWFKPFDLRWAYTERTANLWNRVRPELLDQAWEGNAFLLARRHAVIATDGAAFFFSQHVSDQHALHTDAYFLPVRLRSVPNQNGHQAEMFSVGEGLPRANLSPAARTYLTSLGVPDPDADAETAGLIWMHALAIGYAPAYLDENGDGVRRDWPRLPLPSTKEALLASAALGRQIAALLDTDRGVPGVTEGELREEARAIGAVSREEGGALQPDDLAVTAGWGHAGKGGVTMPGSGRLTRRDYSPDEAAAIAAGAEAQGVSRTEAFARLGETTRDVYLNNVAYWRNVPEKVWGYTIGGYQVMKKWLSYREADLLGRALTADEVREVTHMARRLAAILLLEPQLDENYQRVKADTYPWPT
jgi:hypothetical protein